MFQESLGWSEGGCLPHTECGVLERNFQDIPLIFGESQIVSRAECVSASHPVSSGTDESDDTAKVQLFIGTNYFDYAMNNTLCITCQENLT